MNLDRWRSFIYTPTAFYGKLHRLRSDFEWFVRITRWGLLFFKTSFDCLCAENICLSLYHFYHQ